MSAKNSSDKIMCERAKTIKKYYTDLKYNVISKKQAKTIINLHKDIQLKDIKNLSERFFETASIIEKNLSLFASLCKHIDVVTALVEYLNYYGAQFMFNEEYDKAEIIYKEHYIPGTLILTVYSMCREEALITFLEHAIIEDTALVMGEILTYVKFMIDDSNQANEMILLEDSDLYAVINCLMIIDNSYLNKIWIQESIKQKFLMLAKKYLNYCIKCPIYTFRSQQELLTPYNSLMSIISIWSEDIVAAKNLALCLDGDILFINTHMDFNGGLLRVPFARILDNLMDHATMNSIDKTNTYVDDIPPCYNAVKPHSEEYLKSFEIYDLFYDGMWQKPVEGIYWKRNNRLFANATNEDVRRCVRSAEEGFKIWRADSIASRIKVLSKFATILADNGKFLLSTLVARCTKFARFYENSSGYCAHDEKLELITTRKPRGIIILREENENTLFFRLTQSLLAGNSVIVIFNENFCNIAPYLYMFSMSEVPPGVINMLSSEYIINLESRLCGTQYSVYAKRYFSEGSLIEKYTKSCTQLSLPKQIVHPLK